MNADWLIVPHAGMGRLAFGLSPESVAALASLYGEPGALISQAGVAGDVEEVIAQAGASLSGDLIAAIRGAAQDLANYATQNLTKAGTPILLDYRHGVLDAVTVEARHDEVIFEGERIFALGAVDALRLFERANGAPGRYRDSEAAFDNIAVSLFCFSDTSSGGAVRAVSQAEPDFRQRSVTLRRLPYRPESELEAFVDFSFLPS